MIDLRSDTITKPTPEMLRAMAEAEVGDDVLGDDPTVNRLEARTAEILGKEAAVYMPSGTMTNQVAIRAHTEPGDELLCDADTHTYYYEAGAPAALAGVMVRFVRSERGIFSAEQARAALRPRDVHFPRPRLICIENTHNRGGGRCWPVERIAEVAVVAREYGLAMHLDGARLWNAAVATGASEAECSEYFDSVSVCFSKGLGAPVGSALAGTAEFIERARRFRKMFGGGMRQAGIIAAGALYALEKHRKRLVEDHANARRLAEELALLPGADLDPESVETNIIYARLTGMASDEAVEKLAAAGVAVLAIGPDRIRAVTSLAIGPGDIDRAVVAFRTVLG